MAQDNNPKKLTKRKGFNFFRSYYDVYNELETNKDKIDFIEALLDRQFLGVKPKNLTGMAKFAYISQTNSIDSQVKGYEDKTGQSLTPPTVPPTLPPTQGEVIRGNLPPTLQEEVEGEVKGEVKVNIIPKVETLDFVKLLEYLNSKTGRGHKVLNKTLKSKYLARLKDGFTAKDIRLAIDNATSSQYHKENGYQYLTPEFFSRADTLNKYGVQNKDQSIKLDTPFVNKRNSIEKNMDDPSKLYYRWRNDPPSIKRAVTMDGGLQLLEEWSLNEGPFVILKSWS